MAQSHLSTDYGVAGRTAATTEVLGSSAAGIKERQAAAALVAEQERVEREAEQRRYAEEQRRLQKQVDAEYRSTLTPAQRAGDRVRSLWCYNRWAKIAAFAPGVLAVLAFIFGAVGVGVAGAGVLYVVALVVARRVIEARADKPSPEHVERVHEQLDRVKSTLPTG